MHHLILTLLYWVLYLVQLFQSYRQREGDSERNWERERSLTKSWSVVCLLYPGDLIQASTLLVHKLPSPALNIQMQISPKRFQSKLLAR